MRELLPSLEEWKRTGTLPGGSSSVLLDDIDEDGDRDRSRDRGRDRGSANSRGMWMYKPLCGALNLCQVSLYHLNFNENFELSGTTGRKGRNSFASASEFTAQTQREVGEAVSAFQVNVIQLLL